MGVVSKVFGRFRRRADEAEQTPATAPATGTAPEEAAAVAETEVKGTAGAERDAGQAPAAESVDIPKQTAAGEAADNEADEGARQQQ